MVNNSQPGNSQFLAFHNEVGLGSLIHSLPFKYLDELEVLAAGSMLGCIDWNSKFLQNQWKIGLEAKNNVLTSVGKCKIAQ